MNFELTEQEVAFLKEFRETKMAAQLVEYLNRLCNFACDARNHATAEMFWQVKGMAGLLQNHVISNLKPTVKKEVETKKNQYE